MEALFLSTLRKKVTGIFILGILLISLLGTHWIGFNHSIAHSGILSQDIELNSLDQGPTLGHSSDNCHLLDALTLAGFVASTPQLFLAKNFVKQVQLTLNDSLLSQTLVGLYQSRAPPNIIL